MNSQHPTIGAVIRALRARLGLTLKEMSQRTGIPFSTLSKVEHDRLTLTYDKLQAISVRLGMTMSELLAEPAGVPTKVVNSRRSIATLDGALAVKTPNFEYFYMSPELRNKHMIPIIVNVKARGLDDFGPLIRHEGEEYIYVLKGAIQVHTEFYDAVTLREGESVYIDSSMPHGYTIADGAASATVLCVCSSSQEELVGSIPNVVSRSEPGDTRAPAKKTRTAATKARDGV